MDPKILPNTTQQSNTKVIFNKQCMRTATFNMDNIRASVTISIPEIYIILLKTTSKQKEGKYLKIQKKYVLFCKFILRFVEHTCFREHF